MTPERWALIKDVFAEAVTATSASRSAILDSRCGADSDLRAQVVRLLHHHETSTDADLDVSPVESPVIGRPAFLHPAGGGRIGSYQILSVLGEGGMGVVYLAEQDKPKRTVALKVIKPGLASAAILRRFEHEAQLLGRLQHPGIAQIYEAGTADTGLGVQPFFAMEYVRGRSLSEYSEAAGLDVRKRLDLFAQVCDAVHHAHAKGVVHRDLKPGNILVDESSRPKILDFGVARAVDSDIQLTTFQTDVGQLLGTIPYMSPEQAAGDVADVDTRSDVYALGVVLYELLTDRLPYDLDRKAAHEAIRVIRDEEPARMSSIDKIFRGDIETIVAKALQKERARRYQSAAEFADDIRRYLRNEPIRARPPTTRYQIAKFAKLHRAHETAEALAVNRFLQDLLASAEPLTVSGKEITLRQILDQAATRLENSTLRDQPQIETEVRTSIALTYRALGLFDRAIHHAGRALEIRLQAYGDDHPDAAASMLVLGQLRAETGDLEAAHDVLRRCLEIRRALPMLSDADAVEALNALAGVLLDSGKADEAHQLYEEAASAAQRSLPAGGGRLACSDSLLGLASVLIAKGRASEAEPLIRQALDLQADALPEGHWQIVLSRALLGRRLSACGQFDEAEMILASAWSDLKDNPAVSPVRRRQVIAWLAEARQSREA